MNQKGFSNIVIAIIVGVVIILGSAYVIIKQRSGQLVAPEPKLTSQQFGVQPPPVTGQPQPPKDQTQSLQQTAQSQPSSPTKPSGGSPSQEILVKATGAKYKTVSAKPTSGWFKTGQDADLMLSGIDFNNTGGPLLFNHPGVAASDGVHLLLADRNNNRVLIWNKLPTGNMPPDIVLGQKDFITNNPGTGLDQMNWPVSVSVGGGKVAITDTNNNRILIWNNFPTKNGQPADLVINSVEGSLQQLQAEKKT